MARYYAKEYVGTVRDGTGTALLDGRLIDAKRRETAVAKDNVNALAIADQVYIARLPIGAARIRFSAIADTSFGAATISIGTIANSTKYVNAAPLTATNAWTSLPMPAATALAAPLAAEEEVWLTIGGAGVAAAVVAGFAVAFQISA